MSTQVVSVGIDVAKAKLDVAFVRADSTAENCMFENTVTGIRALIQSLREHGTAATVPCVIESTGAYHLRTAIMVTEAGYRVNCINPLITKKYQRASTRNAKTDRIDAIRLAEIGIREPDLLLFGANYQAMTHRKLLAILAQLEKSLQRLTAVRASAAESFALLKTKVDLRAFDRALLAISAQQETIMALLATQLSDKERAVAKSVRGLTEKKLAVVVGALADKQFENRDQLVAFLGLDVMPRESGQWRGRGRLSKRGNGYLRKTLHQVAWGLMMHNDRFKEIYRRARGRGKDYTTALIIVARKFLYLLYAVLLRPELSTVSV